MKLNIFKTLALGVLTMGFVACDENFTKADFDAPIAAAGVLPEVTTGDADALLNDMVDQEIIMTGAFMDKHPAPVVDEGTGEVIGTTSKYRIIIFDNEGKTYATGSYGIYNSLNMIIDIFGNPSEEHPIKVKVSKKATSNGHNTLTLIRVK